MGGSDSLDILDLFRNKFCHSVLERLGMGGRRSPETSGKRRADLKRRYKLGLQIITRYSRPTDALRALREAMKLILR
jgi:hypothetical protein